LILVNLPSRAAVEEVTRAFGQRRLDLPVVLVSQREEARQWAEELGFAAFAPRPARLEGGICENLDAD
jgi:hypothetical protein